MISITRIIAKMGHANSSNMMMLRFYVVAVQCYVRSVNCHLSQQCADFVHLMCLIKLDGYCHANRTRADSIVCISNGCCRANLEPGSHYRANFVCMISNKSVNK